MRRFTIPIVLTILLVSAVFVLGQGNSPVSNPEPLLRITVQNRTCSMVLEDGTSATPEATDAAQTESATEAAPNRVK